MLLAYPIFYRNYGVRRAQQLAFPKVNGMDAFHFPRNSLFHYVPEDDSQTDPDTDSLYFKGYTKRFLIDYVYTLTSTEGNPRHRSFSIRTMVLPFLHAHKEFRYIKEPYTTSTDINTLMVLNYGYLDKFYIYNKQLMTGYWKWKNLQNTLWAKVEEVAKSSDRNQFVFFDVPDGLPAMSYLRVFEKKTSPALLKIFNNPFKLFVLEVWKWLGEETRQTSILNQISSEHLANINLVFMRNGKWIVFNLGYLDQWLLRKGQEKSGNVAQYPELLIKKLFLKMIMTLQSHVVELAQDAENTQEQETEENENLPEDLEEQDQKDDLDEEDSANKEEAEHKKRLLNAVKKKETEPNEDVSKKETKVFKKDFSDVESLDAALTFSDQELNDILESVDQDLEDLEKIEQKRLQERGIKVNAHGEEETAAIQKPTVTQADLQVEVLSVKSLDQSLNDQLNTYADYGVMPASEYRSVKKAIEKSATLKDPYGSDALISEASVVTPEMTTIVPSKTVLMSSENMADPSMAKSTLSQYDRHYLDNVFKKDIMAAVQGVKRAGVIVEDHKVETEANVLGSFEHHVIKLRPIDGKSSTLHFKIPVIKEDGTFMSNGNKYIMRKQRTDLPIRKINPTTVALSSYYGKTFIERSIFARLAPEQWIAKKLQLAALDDTSDIHQVSPANVYDNYFKAPYLYNAMATVFKSVVTSKFELEFDHRWRDTHFTPELLEKAEQKGARVCGIFKDKTPIVMSTQNKLYAFKGDQFVEMGSLYKVLNLGIQDSPIDYAAVRIFSKKIPVGFLLSYLLGFEKLLVLLGAKYRIVESGRTGSLAENEWPIRFKDRVFVFDRQQELVSLILGGFTAYKDIVRLYEAELFNQKEVYFNIIESQGMGSIYLKEVDNQKAMFIDPITKEILEEMHEPLTLEGLFIRSAEMLMNYNHPDFQDLRAMRIRGYERVSGAIYRELAHSVRDYNSKSIRGRSQISLNPYAVWKTITNDNSIKIVEDINPIQNLKESEAVTYVGEGGRNRDTLSKDTRAYHPTDMGVVSEATIDSGDVGINAYLSANPNFKSVRGLVDFEKAADISNTNLLSTSALLAVGSENDD